VRPISEARLVVHRFRCRACFELYQEQLARDQEWHALTPRHTTQFRVLVPLQAAKRSAALRAARFGSRFLPGLKPRASSAELGEDHSVPAELSFKDRYLVAQNEYLRILLSVTHRQQPYGSEGVSDRQVSKAQQHELILPQP
jgi:hypothetical protein